MTIPAEKVKELRELTGAGFMECKKALVTSQGDIEKAIENMRISGALKADKKASRTAAEGLVLAKSSSDGKHAAVVDVNCETDFVARDENFKAFANAVLETALAVKAQDVAPLLNATLVGSDMTVDAARAALVSKIGENVQIRRVAFIQAKGRVGTYVHGGRIAVLVDMTGGDEDLVKDIAMHIAALGPRVVAPGDVPQDLIAKEKEIFTAQALESGKPMEIIEKMIGGRIKKFVDEISLLGQPFVKDTTVSVGSLLQKSNAQVHTFVRYEVGEGIEKKTENFAEEVMAQVRQS